MKFYTVDVMIPTYKPGQEFAELLPRLLEQTYPIRSIRVVNTGKKFWNPAWEQLSDKIMVEHIRPRMPCRTTMRAWNIWWKNFHCRM